MLLSVSGEGSAAPVDPEEWAGGHLRLVWLQDHGNGADSLAHGKNLVVYGYDSRDGLGERPLLKKKGSFFKPLITPDGKGVIVSDRKAREMYLVDWESGKKTVLGQGIAVEVWKEEKGRFFFNEPRTWVYCFSGLQPENKYGTSQPLYRFPLDNPKKKELIWDRTNMAWSNLQLSRDGEMLGGLFPWPHGGVLHVKDRKWKPLGKGCWTSLSPDNSKLLWIFDGLHRNIQMYDVAGGGSWKVKINNGPGINGFEVYHPRWSNHPRYFVLTGPYEKGEGGNRIGGGGEKVEIYIGRFDAKARNVESWLQISKNKFADFYPDLWIENGDKANLEDILPETKVATKTVQWPGERKDLLFLWDNMKSSNQLPEDSPIGFYQCTVELRGHALHTRKLQLALAGGWGDTGDAGAKLGTVAAGAKELGVEFVLLTSLKNSGSILTFAGNDDDLSIQQETDSILVTRNGERMAGWNNVVNKAGEPLHIAINFSSDRCELFINGTSAGAKKLKGKFSIPAVTQLYFGDKSGKWGGMLQSIACYSKGLSTEQINTGTEYAMQQAGEDEPIEKLVVQGRLLETTEIPSPDAIGAYSRALVINTYSVDSVTEGEYNEDRILVAEWAVLDRKIIKEYANEVETETLTLEKFSDHPELEGERQMMDLFEPDLEMFYRVSAVDGKLLK